MASLPSLPRELQDKIAINLCTHCTPTTHTAHEKPDKLKPCLDPGSATFQYYYDEQENIGALASLCLVSKACHKFATPFLYHSPLATSNPHKASYVSLTRTILQRPDLACHVSHLSRGGWYRGDESEEVPCQMLSPDDVELFKAAVAKYYHEPDGGFTDVNDWPLMDNHALDFDRDLQDRLGPDHLYAVTAMEHARFESALVSLIMAACPNLEKIEIILGWHPFFRFPAPGTVLPHLKSLEVVYTMREQCNYLLNGLDGVDKILCAAPNLTRLTTWRLQNIIGGAGNYMTFRKPAEVLRLCVPWIWLKAIPVTLRELVLDHSELVHSDLAKLLNACPFMERIRIQLMAGKYNWRYAPDALQGALVASPCASTIRTLEIDPSMRLHAARTRDFMLGRGGAMASLASLEALEELEIDTTSIWLANRERRNAEVLVNLLPASIRTFKLARGRDGLDRPKGLFAAVMELARWAPSQFPALKTVEIFGLDYDQAEKARVAFEKHDVVFRFCPWARQMPSWLA
ncbi:hypothetical protein B0T19DRAFT_401532 [Cercophora scortea]|uniref:Uncharacterized protein n=1 Tax=Cercophora scortea TaxID=314031 RepID=A0AAE0IDV6_9PEZI|nr:hypothetical protein B0T19DRAFT_401532 [Cercophora scortea]